ncbi:MAG TPA: hypothetical protein VGE29_01600 [Prosthecobacter sp.]
MKTYIATALLLATSCAFADLAVYNGAKVTKTTSADGSGTVVQKFIQVIDLDTSQVAVITLGTQPPRKKVFVVEPLESVFKTVVKDGKTKRTLTVLATASSSTDVVSGVTDVTSSTQVGGNLPVSLKTGQKTELPRNLQGEASWVTGGSTTTAAAYVDVKSTAVLQDKLSRIINDAGETLEVAVDRLVDDLVAKGYVDATPVPET